MHMHMHMHECTNAPMHKCTNAQMRMPMHKPTYMHMPMQGGYFLVADAGQPDVEFCEWLAEEKGVCCTPMSVFYATPQPPEQSTLVRFTI